MAQAYEVASRVRRVAAALTDFAVFIPLIYLDRWIEPIASPGILFVYVLITLQLDWLYTTIMHGTLGQTLGKLRNRIKVVSYRDAEKLGYRRALLRDLPYVIFAVIHTLIWIASFAPLQFKGLDDRWDQSIDSMIHWMDYGFLFWILAELVSMMFHPERRSIHDLIAGTIVIQKPTMA